MVFLWTFSKSANGFEIKIALHLFLNTIYLFVALPTRIGNCFYCCLFSEYNVEYMNIIGCGQSISVKLLWGLRWLNIRMNDGRQNENNRNYWRGCNGRKKTTYVYVFCKFAFNFMFWKSHILDCTHQMSSIKGGNIFRTVLT